MSKHKGGIQLVSTTPLKSNGHTGSNETRAGATNPSYLPDEDSKEREGLKKNVPTYVNSNEVKDSEYLRKQNRRDFDNLDEEGLPGQYEESSDDEYDSSMKIVRGVVAARRVISNTYSNHTSACWTLFWIVLAGLYFAYFIAAMVLSFDVKDEGSMRLLVVTILVTVFVAFRMVWRRWVRYNDLSACCQSENQSMETVNNGIYWFLVIATSLFVVIFVIVDIAIDKPENLISALGIVVFVLVFFIFSKNPGKVSFRPVFWGLALQFYFALLILRTDVGYQAFNWMGDRVREFLAYTDAGAAFVFGEEFGHHFFAFAVLPVVVFFSSIVSVLYYLGVMQFIIRYIAKFLAFCLGTAPTESLNAAGNIFIGQSEAPLMIRPFIKDMTKSELHAVCTGGFATVAGSVMAAYILMGVPANHLISASVMSAPAALAMSKLFYPEKKKSKANADAVYAMQKGHDSNIIEAASNGASVSIRLVANIAVNLIAFLSILEFLDRTLIWAGHRVKMYDPELTFRFICSYVFYPISWLIGTSTNDVRKIAGLIGTKTFLNEFVAYSELGVFIANTKKYNSYISNSTGFENGTRDAGDDIILNYTGEVLKGGILTYRSVVLATYALCGFSNIGSIGIMLGALGGMAPTRKKDITKVLVRAMIAGNVACFMTACIAGLLYK